MPDTKPPLAILGGTFDPIHYGHLRAAQEGMEALGLDELTLLPAGDPPHRSGTHASASHRLAMLRLAVADHPELKINDLEVRRSGPSYMVDTLLLLRKAVQNQPLVLLLGQDAANGLDRWHRWQELFDLTHLLIMTRPESESRYSDELQAVISPRVTGDYSELHRTSAGLVYRHDITQLAISSTDIRARIADGKSVRFLLPDRVLGYIDYHGLYQPAQEAPIPQEN